MMGLILAHVKNTPKRIALVGNGGATRITYEQMDYLNGKLYVESGRSVPPEWEY